MASHFSDGLTRSSDRSPDAFFDRSLDQSLGCSFDPSSGLAGSRKWNFGKASTSGSRARGASLVLASVLIVAGFGCGKALRSTGGTAGHSRTDPEAPTSPEMQTIMETPPIITPEAWKPGAYWTWRDRHTGTCERWTFEKYEPAADTRPSTVLMHRDRALDCENFDETPLRFRFNARTGRISLPDFPGQNPPQDFEMAFDRLNGIAGGNFYRVVKKVVDFGVGKFFVYRTDIYPDHFFIMTDYNPELVGVLLRSADWRLLDFNKAHAPGPYPDPKPLPVPTPPPTPPPKPPKK